MFLAVTLALTPLTTHAETSNTHFPITYTSESGNYTATKLSHPNDDVMQPDGIIEYENGINDRGENYSWSAVGMVITCMLVYYMVQFLEHFK